MRRKQSKSCILFDCFIIVWKFFKSKCLISDFRKYKNLYQVAHPPIRAKNFRLKKFKSISCNSGSVNIVNTGRVQ